MPEDITEQIIKAKSAAVKLSALDTETKNKALDAMADALDRNRAKILEANAEDMSAAGKLVEEGRLGGPMVKRLKVDDVKITGMIEGVRDVASLDDPVWETISTIDLDDDLALYQVRCPIGVIGVIFESRPDVVPQIMSLCLKSGNAVAFKGGSEAAKSNKALFEVLVEAAYSAGVPKDTFVLMETRHDISAILGMDEYIDLLIPRGSNSFVRYIQENTRIPVLGHAAGICTTYVDSDADLEKALRVTLDAKIQYPAACNATENILVHRAVAEEFLPMMCDLFADNGVEIRADPDISRIKGVKGTVPVSEDDWKTEYGAPIVSVKIVDSIQEAVEFIGKYGSNHTDAIITENTANMKYFAKMVDSADVFVNASTRFADGYRFGKGAEVGISTSKIHARGPVGMEGLMIYKYILIGKGQEVRGYADGSKKFKHIHVKRKCPL
ncbi:MAG: glutamate-5-semialdehyde dehydrogenase [Candidatus Methanomethylophilaceae archaeon]|nr:glutamate-5-semialdehyde dehydrogenase [Candidatus Methanomethylophilaceae archaeon]